MINSISDSLSVQQRNPTLPAATGERLNTQKTQPLAVSPLSTHRLEIYVRWAKVTQGQHSISAYQVAEQGLKQVIQLLRQLKKQVQTALALSGELRTTKTTAALAIQSRLSRIRVEYRNKPLLDHQLNLISAKHPATPRQFTLRSIELAQTKPRDERVLVQLDSHSVMTLLPANQSQNALRAQLNQNLATLGISIAPSTSPTTVFDCDESCWQKIIHGIMMTGQGQRLPAGEARIIKVEEQLSWQDPRQWRFGTELELKQTSAKVEKSLFKLQQQLRELNDASDKIHRQLQRTNKQHPFEELEKTLKSLDRLMQATPFSLQMTSVMAQANVTRSQVSSLLE